MKHLARKKPVLIEFEILEARMEIETLEGTLIGNPGDVLITGVKGEKYPCRRDIFDATYDVVSAEDEPASATVFADLCFDFDGVIHSYLSGCQGVDVIPDAPVPGALLYLYQCLDTYRVAIYSSRSASPAGLQAMQAWLTSHDEHFRRHSRPKSLHRLWQQRFSEGLLVERILFPTSKPAAKVYLDDRAFRFDGEWPTDEELEAAMIPWYEQVGASS